MSEDKNIAVNLSMLQAVDDGSSYSKSARWGVSADGARTIINSKVPTSITEGAANIQMVAAQGVAQGATYEVNGEVYTIDKTLDGKDVRATANHQISNGLIAQTQFALESCGHGGQEVFIATGVPVKQFFSGPDSTPNSELIAKKEEVFVNAAIKNSPDDRGNITKIDKSRLVTVIGNLVLPEAIGAYFDIAIDNDGNQTDLAQSWVGDVLIIDMGSVTTDITIVGPGGNIRKDGIDTMDDMGFLRLNDMLERRLIEGKYAIRSLTKANAEMAFLTGEIPQLSGPLKVGAECEIVLEEGMKPVIERIKQIAGDGINNLSAIIAVGGGAEAIKNHFGELSAYVITPENPQFANANGFLKLLTFFSKQKTGPVTIDIGE